ncbi:hypothetical protein VCUG_01717 [Vavraia culicis subsp. floridensis]|uniref:N-acetyltransferase domain-containing protein n=1 Tax=Vavraia culicis (isolate floridensis) TaxID=948595 RepID=L2GTY8_VAVCU|nr:uncharacterized protein VCUG_01717 [Vavraia culicis subsp. floridensis]ELA46817.1 hypothetical protein VCUG_01717 [Vavraia culicis subsp. floridensis]
MSSNKSSLRIYDARFGRSITLTHHLSYEHPFNPYILSMKIRPLKGHDIPNVQQLNHLTLPENYTLEFLSIHYLLNPSTNYVAVLGNMLVGYLLADKNGTVISLSVEKAYRNMNVATNLMHVFINRNGNDKVCLCVRVSNYRAVKFYVGRFNGVIRYVVKNYYENGDDAYFVEIERKCGGRENAE